MDKKGFLNLFKVEDEKIVVKLWEDIELSSNIDYYISTEEFFPPNIWDILDKTNINGMRFLLKGLTDESEKKNIIILPRDYSGEEPEFQLVFFKIDGTNKFKTLGHKDFLGTIMSLGIKREVLGDLIVKDNIAYGIIHKDKFDIVRDLERVGNIPVKISVIKEEEVPKSEFKEVQITVPSPRLDSVVGEIANSSRQKSTTIIEEGLVMVNYVVQKSKSYEVKVGDIITVKKVGKFIFENILGENKKGKTKILLKQFI